MKTKKTYAILDEFIIQNIVKVDLSYEDYRNKTKEELLLYFNYNINNDTLKNINVMPLGIIESILQLNLEIIKMKTKKTYVILDEFIIQNVVKVDLSYEDYKNMTKEELLLYFNYKINEDTLKNINIMSLGIIESIFQLNLEIIKQSHLNENLSCDEIANISKKYLSEKDS